jgi:hypothetical protein
MKLVPILFLLASCSLFKGSPSLTSQDPQKLLKALQVTGEGKGRLTLGQNQYVFGVESLLNEERDYILAVTIPVHGEEVLIFADLHEKKLDQKSESFERRIEGEFSKLRMKNKPSSKEFLRALRSLVRFALAPSLGLQRNCSGQQDGLSCLLDQESYTVKVSEKKIIISRKFSRGGRLVLEGQNLTGSIFTKTDIRFLESEEEKRDQPSPFSLELFWQN